MNDLDPKNPKDAEILRLRHDLFWAQRHLEQAKRVAENQKARADALYDDLVELQCRIEDERCLGKGNAAGVLKDASAPSAVFMMAAIVGRC